MNRWQTLTDLQVDSANAGPVGCSIAMNFLSMPRTSRGKCGGVDEALVEMLGQWRGKPITYAGGVASMADMELVQKLSGGNVDVTVGSALDIFGGTGVVYEELTKWNQR